MLSFFLRFRPSALFASTTGPGGPRRRRGSLTLATAVGVPLALGQAMGAWSIPDVATWYPKLEKPSWTPPVWLFGPTWGALYTTMGVASHRVWLAGGGALPLGLYVLQLALNLACQPTFFKAHNLAAASKVITALLVVLVPRDEL